MSSIQSFKLHKVVHSSNSVISRKGLEKLDFLLLLIEALEINGIKAMIDAYADDLSDNKSLDSVELWKRRAHNPLRRSSRRGALSFNDVNQLISLVSTSSTRLYPILRQLLSAKEPLSISTQRWQLLSNRFIELVKERMNLKRGFIQNLMNEKNSIKYLKDLILLLALTNGKEGAERLKYHIFQIK
tara:strand:+ start:2075 stop:2632 length:558 start_codon:yes stop_codon:yes gene_type:complete